MINLFQPALGPEEFGCDPRRLPVALDWKGAVTDQFESDFAVHFFENSMPAPVLRVCGVLGVLAGLARVAELRVVRFNADGGYGLGIPLHNEP